MGDGTLLTHTLGCEKFVYSIIHCSGALRARL